MKLSHSVSGAVRQFSYWIANGTVGYPLLEGIDYFDEFRESPSLLETVYAIFINNLEVDENGQVLNAKYAEQRAAQYIKQWCIKDYKAEPTFDGSKEVELYWQISIRRTKIGAEPITKMHP